MTEYSFAKIVRFLSLVFFIFGATFLYADKLQESKRVLLIQSYHNTFRWTNQVTQGFLNRMEHLAPNTEVDVIYLDLLRKGSQKKTKLEKAVRKIRQGFYDLVVVSGDDGIDLFRACAGEIPAKQPVLFLGWINSDLTVRKEFPNSTALIQKVDIEGTLRLAEACLNGAPEKIFVIVDKGNAGKRIAVDIQRAIVQKTLPPLKILNGEQYDTQQLLEFLADQPKNAIVIYTGWYRIGINDHVALRGTGSQIATVSRAPVFCTVDSWLQNGMVGGVMAVGKQQGQEAADIAAQILKGAPAASLPFRTAKNSPIIDVYQLHRVNLYPERFPPAAILLNEPVTFWKVYHIHIIVAAALFLIICLLLVLVTINMVRFRAVTREREQEQKKHYRQLNAIAERFRTTLNSIGDAVIATDPESRITLINPVAVKLTACPEDVAGKKLAEVFHIVSGYTGKHAVSPVEEALRTGEIVELVDHIDLIALNGIRYHISASAAPIRNTAGAVTGVVLVFRDVTGEQEQKAQNAATLRTLQQVTSWVNLSYFNCNLDGSGLSTQTGLNWRHEADGRPVSPRRWVFEEDREMFYREWNQLRNGSKKEIDLTYRSNYDGTMQYYRMSATLWRNPDSDTPRIFGTIQNVTAIAEKERKYNDTNALLKALVETLPCLVFIKDASDDFRYLVANRTFAGFLKQTPEDMVGKTDFEIFGEHEFVKRFRRDDDEALRAGKNIESLETIKEPDGSIRYLHGVKGIVRQTDGRLLLVGMATEVTELEQAKRKEEDARKLLQAVLDNIPAGVILKDPADDFRYLIWNKALEKISGIPGARVLGRTDREIDIYPGCREKFIEEDRRTISGGKEISFVEVLPTVRGTEVVCNTHKIPFSPEPGKTFLLGLCMDITKEWALEKEKNKLIQRLNDHIRNEKMLNHCLQTITIENDLDKTINTILKAVGENCDADRCYVVRCHEPQHTIDTAYEWLREGIPSQLKSFRKFDLNKVDGIYQSILNEKEIAVSDLRQAPEVFRELAEHFPERSVDMKSLLLCSIWDNGQFWGVIGISYVRRRHDITEADKETLRSACNLFMLALERNRQMELAAESMSLQKQIIDNITIPIAMFDKDCSIMKANAAAAAMMSGANPQDIIGRKCYQVLCGCDEPPEWCPFRQVMETGETVHRDVENRGRRYHMTCQPIFDRHGNVESVFEASVDMTEHYQQQLALENSRNKLLASNEQLRLYIEQDKAVSACLESLLFYSDFKDALRHVLANIGRLLGANTCSLFRAGDERCTRITTVENWGRTEDTAKRRRIAELKMEEYPTIQETLFTKGEFSIDRADAERKDTPLRRDVLKYLTWRKANALCCVAIHHKGKYWGHIGAEYTDGATFGAPGLRLMHSAARMIELLIERSDSTRQLARSEYEKKMIFNILNIPLVLFDAERKIIRVNPAAEKLVGMTEAEIIQRPCPETFCNHSMSRGKCPVERTLKTGLPQTQEAVLNGRNYQLSTLPFFENGKMVNVLQSYVDMTDACRQQEKLKQAMFDAQAADRAKSFFLATMSHEIRTPLNAVIGFSELLQNRGLSEKEQMEYLRSIHFAGTALLRLINDILDLSKIEAGQVRIVPEKMDFTTLCSEMQSIFMQKAKEKNLVFRLVYSGNLPLLYLDNQRMRQVLLNLLGNAVKFTDKGSIALETEFKPEDAAHGTLVIRVRDTGIGISEESRTRIFEPFVQDNASRDRAYQGTGLGLSISSRLVRKMGGDLQVESEVGRGSCFTITLHPVRYSREAEEPAAVPETVAAGQDHLRVLLVDDVPMNLKVLSALLRRLGIQSRQASSGAEALHVLNEFTPQIILSDMWMPGMSGAQLAAEIRRKPQGGEILLVALTADTEANTTFSMHDFNAIILKPVTIEKLTKLLSRISAGKISRSPENDKPYLIQ